MFPSLSIFLQTCMIFCFLIVIHNCIIDRTGAKLYISAGHSYRYRVMKEAFLIKGVTWILWLEMCIMPCSTVLNCGCQLCVPVVISRVVHASQKRIWASCPFALLGKSGSMQFVVQLLGWGLFKSVCLWRGFFSLQGAGLCWHFVNKISPFHPTYLDF